MAPGLTTPVLQGPHQIPNAKFINPWSQERKVTGVIVTIQILPSYFLLLLSCLGKSFNLSGDSFPGHQYNEDDASCSSYITGLGTGLCRLYKWILRLLSSIISTSIQDD